jgi:hypothetical protein
MKDIDDQVAVKQGFWFYGGLTLCPVRIVHLHTRYGSQDPEVSDVSVCETNRGVRLQVV